MSQIHIGVFGLGRFGSSLVRVLSKLKTRTSIQVRVLDRDPERINDLKDQYDDALIMDIEDVDQEDLKKQIEDLDLLIIAIGENTLPVLLLAHMAVDIASNNSTTSSTRILCRAHNETTRKILLKLGINKSDIFSPEEEAALSFAKRIANPNSVDALPLDSDQSLIQIPTPEKWVGKHLVDIDMRKKYNANLLCLRKKTD